MKRRQTLETLVTRRWAAVDAAAVIAAGEILVEGRVITNPRAQITAEAPLVHRPPSVLAGRRKLGGAIDHFRVAAGNVALDVGASTGGVTPAGLDARLGRVSPLPLPLPPPVRVPP